MLTERQKSILEATVWKHILTGHPIASQELLHEHRLEISPATIRSEMQYLDEEGYLTQPHTSAGRIPTDHGYRFFVDNLLSAFSLTVREEKRIERAFDAGEKEQCIRELGNAVAELSGTFVIAGILDSFFYKTGFSRIMEQPESHDVEYIKTFSRLIDVLDEGMGVLIKECGEEAERIFIGEENPIEEAHSYSMVVSRWRHSDGSDGFVTCVSPRRTDYQRQKAIAHCINSRTYDE